jgi:uncharacterized protein
MPGETNLETLLSGMHPMLHRMPYIFCSVDWGIYCELPFEPLGSFHEPEGISIVVTREQAVDLGLPFETAWACITLTVRSSLCAVGFLAAIADKLAQAGISVNPVSAFHHDHLFIPWEKRARAMKLLGELSRPQDHCH